MFRLSKSLIRKCSTLPPSNISNKLSIYELAGIGGTVIGGCVGVNLMYNEMNNEIMDDTRWGQWEHLQTIGSKVFMLLSGALFGGAFGTIIGWSFPVSFPILGFIIWDDYDKRKRKIDKTKD